MQLVRTRVFTGIHPRAVVHQRNRCCSLYPLSRCAPVLTAPRPRPAPLPSSPSPACRMASALPSAAWPAADTDFPALCDRIQTVIGQDVGSRGIAAITLPKQLQHAAKVFCAARGVVILTGFPCRVNDSPPTESDGPPGAIALAVAALRLGKRVAIATDNSSAGVLMRCAVGMDLPSMGDFGLFSFPPRDAWGVEDDARLASLVAEYDHSVAIERAGQAADGGFYTMRGISMNHLVAPIDSLLTSNCASAMLRVEDTPDDVSSAWYERLAADRRARSRRGTAPQNFSPRLSFVPSPSATDATSVGSASPPIPTRTSTGIGDGGNECGMGAVYNAVRKHIPRGELIACAIPADNLITAGVSNWGGWGLVAAVEGLVQRYAATAAEAAAAGVPPMLPPHLTGIPASVWATAATARAGWLLPTEDQERMLASYMVAAGARDGITGALDGSVDGMPLETHLGVLDQLRSVLATARRAASPSHDAGASTTAPMVEITEGAELATATDAAHVLDSPAAAQESDHDARA